MKKHFQVYLFLFLLFITNASAQCLSGAYTIGGTTPSYATITSAVSALTVNGVCGPVVFNIRSGTYNEQITIPAITGSSVVNTITFQSETLDSTAVVLTRSITTPFVLRLNGCMNIVFNKITIQSSFTSAICVVELTSNSNNITFKNNLLQGPVLATSSGPMLVRCNAINNNNVVFDDNYFLGGISSIFYSSSSVSVFIPGTKVRNNFFKNPYDQGIYLNRHLAPEIIGNTIERGSFGTGSFNGIGVYNCTDNYIVSKNKSQGGIAVTNCNSTIVNPGLVANNFVTASKFFGMQIGADSYLNVINNSIVANTPVYYALTIGNNGAGVNVLNNVFANIAGGYAVHRTNGPINSFDNNNLYTTGPVLCLYNGIGFSSLLSWQSSTGWDLNSISVDPYFFSLYDLHTVSASMNARALVSSFVMDDIDGDVRDLSTPDIGADEFLPLSTDASLIQFNSQIPPCPGTSVVRVLASNAGSNTIASMIINWEINGVAQTPFNFSGSLISTNDTAFDIGGYNFIAGTPYVLKSWVSNPNGIPDMSALNDTISVSFQTGMSGTYTVGGVTPDYASFNAAVSDLILRGVCAAVTFNVRAGTYTEYVSIPSIQGSNVANNITFQSESGINTSVTLSNNIVGNTSTVLLNNADYVIFKNMTLASTNGLTSGSRGLNNIVSITNGSDHISLINNKINGAYGYSVSTGDGSSWTSNGNVFLSNEFSGGYGGVYLSTSASAANQILNNAFNNQTTAININSSEDSLIVSGNTIVQSVVVSQYSVILQSFFNSSFIKNKFNTPSNVLQISMNGCSGVIANNFITCTGTAAVTGVDFGGSDSPVDFVNNSINFTNTNSSSVTCSFTAAPASFKNNNVLNVGGGRALYVAAAVPLNGFSNYNNLFVTGSQLAMKNTTGYANLALWKAATGYDVNSISVNTPFTSATDLHTTSSAVNNIGTSVSGIITDDIDGDIRSLTTPDIGADEFIVIITDAALTSFDSLVTACPGTTPIKVKLYNSGGPTINSATIFWQVNGVMQTTNSWTGSLVSADTGVVLLGSYNLIAGTLYTIKAWVKNPNGSADPVATNDTIKKLNFRTSLSGNYTIGGTTPDYATFNAAVSDLILKGVCGAVTFNVRNGVYNEQITIPYINGSSSVNSIVFQSQSGDSSTVTLSYSPSSTFNNYAVKFNASAFVSIKKITIKSLGSSFSTVIDFSGNNRNLSLLNNVLESSSTTSSLNYYSVLFSNGSQNKNLLINNNVIKNGSYGVHLIGMNTVQLDSGLVISNNTFLNQYFTGVYLKNQNASSVLSNTLTSNSTGTWTGINVDYCLNSQNISRNKIINLPISATTIGINVINSSGSALLRGLVSNNMISTSSDAIKITGCAYQNIYYNSVLVKFATGKCLNLSSNSNLNNANNIYRNIGGGYAIYVGSVANLSMSNHNDFSTTGTNLAYLSGVNYTTLTAWQAASSNDAMSYNVIPNYFSNSDLHLNIDTTLSNKGLPIAGVVDDIDGENRNATTPDIGADEFVFNSLDAALTSFPTLATNLCNGIRPISVQLKNEGSDVLTIAVINWSVNGVTQPVYNWTGSLILTDTLTVLVGSYAFTAGAAYTVKSWVSSPNGMADVFPANDTIVQFIRIPLNGIYTIGGVSPDFSTITAAVSVLNSNGVCGPVTFKIRTGIYSEEVHLKNCVGSSAINRVTFESEALDSLAVDWRNVSAVSAGFSSLLPLVILDSTDYITFRKITFRSISPLRAYCMNMGNGANYNEVKNCQFVSQVAASGSYDLYNRSQLSIINASGLYPVNTETNNYNIIENNAFINGLNGVCTNSISLSYDSGNEILNNFFSQQGSANIYANRQKGMKIIDNVISSVVSASYGAIYLEQVRDSLIIVGNNVSTKNGLRSLYVQLTGSPTVTISNNYFHFSNAVGATPTEAVSIFTTGSSVTNFINNTIRVSNASSMTVAVTVQNYGDILSYNNNITIDNSNYAFSLQSFAGSSYTGNNNNFHNLSGNLIFYNTGYATLSAYQLGTGKDLASINKNPNYFNSYSYEINSVDLNNAAIPFPGLTEDIEGNMRNATTPDIGCYEFAVMSIDAGIKNINSAAIHCPGSSTAKVTIRNFGTTVLTSTSIGWTVNGVMQTPFNYTGSIIYNDSVVNITIGSFLSSGSDVIKAFPITVNGVADMNASNDTVLNNPLAGSLSGTYTIGSAGADFVSFTAAKNKLVADGVCGSVLFRVFPGAYIEKVIFPSIAGASVLNTITFESYYGNRDFVTIAEYADNSFPYYEVVRLDGAKYFRFKNMSFNILDNDPSITSAAVGMLGGHNYAKNIVIDSCVFIGISQNAPTIITELAMSFTDCDSVQIINNFIKDVSLGIDIQDFFFVSNATGFLLENNTISNVVTALRIKECDKAIVRSNSFESYSHPYGVVGSPAIQIEECKAITVEKNQLFGFDMGLDMISTNALGIVKSTVVNNFIDGITEVSFCKDIEFLFNNMQLRMFDPLYSPNITATLNLYNDTSIVLLNNNISNLRPLASSWGAVYSQGAVIWPNPFTLVFAESDNNNFYCPYTSFISTTNFQMPLMSTPEYSLALWQYHFLLDSNSVSIDPQYTSSIDLHVLNPLLAGLGSPIASVTTDIDNQLRNALPTIGADEISSFLTNVWPGDANNDSVANNFDLLPIGLYYSQMGSPRVIVSNNWQAYLANDWGVTQPSGADIKHADCNGDGIINANDTLAVNLNFASIHAFAPAPTSDERLLLPSMYFYTSSSTYMPGDWVNADVMLGNAALPVEGLYGIAFNINYDASLVQPGTESLIYPASWFTSPGLDGIKLSNIIPLANTAYGAETRIDQQNSDGFGKIATFRFQINTSISTTSQLNFSFGAYAANDSVGNSIYFASLADSIQIVPLATALNDTDNINGVGVYPNPYSGSTNIYYSLVRNSNVSVEIYNTIGQKIETIVNANQNAGEYKYSFSAKEKGYDAGIYFVKFTIDGKATMKKIAEVK